MSIVSRILRGVERRVAGARRHVDAALRRVECEHRGHDWQLDDTGAPLPDGTLPYAVRCAHCHAPTTRSNLFRTPRGPK